MMREGQKSPILPSVMAPLATVFRKLWEGGGDLAKTLGSQEQCSHVLSETSEIK